ncbi:MAG: aldo/keto reductase [Candidatus Lindowbacteria bacterium]|nr:aldo/keto reductase [Candidatus Lindowbacteria bacterium]
MKRIKLGATGLEVTELCFGTLTMSWLQAGLSPTEGSLAIARALDLGVNFLDTAQAYRTYEHVSLAIKGREQKPVIATKSHAQTYDDMKTAVEEALAGMGVSRLDAILFHLIRSEEDYRERADALKCLLEYKDKGVVRSLGLSTHTIEGLKPALKHSDIEIVLPCINRKGLGINDGTLEELLPLLRELNAMGKAVYAMKPLAGGHLFNEVADSLNFVRGLGSVHSLAVGMKTTAEVEMNVCIFNDQPVPAEIFEKARQVSKKLKIYQHICQGCGSCVENCEQGALTLVDEKATVDESKCILCGYCAEECPVFCIRVI